MYRPGDTLIAEFITSNSSTGAAVDADALPTCTLVRNGTDDATVVTVVHIDTGRYKASCAINPAWLAGDSIALVANTVIATVARRQLVLQGPLVETDASLIASLLATPVPVTNTPNTIADAFNAARAQAFGAWTLSGTTLTLYGPDGTTPVRVFTLNSATAPTARV